MHELLNVLYVQTQGSYLQLESDTVRVVVESETKLRAPLLRLGGIVMFGQVSISPFLVHRCAEDGRSLVWLGRNGRFKARVEGPTRGNVLLRRAQHLALSRPEQPSRIACQIVAAKIQNSRQILLRAARESDNEPDRSPLGEAAARLAVNLSHLKGTNDLNEIRGTEGDAARTYFGVFGHMIRGDRATMGPERRTLLLSPLVGDNDCLTAIFREVHGTPGRPFEVALAELPAVDQSGTRRETPSTAFCPSCMRY
jgi:CRISP-associated protein Cas1